MSKRPDRFDSTLFFQRVQTLIDSLGIILRDITPYTQAFVHRSVLNENTTPFTSSNERLEFLGDAVLELVITEALFQEFPDKPEGELTDIRSALVRGKNLAIVAESLGLHDFLLLSRGEILSSGNKNPYLLANTMEALIGATYLDAGYDAAKKLILTHVWVTLPSIMQASLYVDPKSHLQAITQARWGEPPTYTLIEEVGEDHNKVYIIEASINQIFLGRGQGTSKKKAQQEAAENALGRKGEWLVDAR